MGIKAFTVAAILAVVMLAIPVVCYLEFVTDVKPYELSRVVGVSLSVAFAAFAAVMALAQYHRNSHDKRVERSMSFWQRANSEPFTGYFRTLVEEWVKKGTPEMKKEMSRIAESDDAENLQLELQIEHMLDFYDEACTAIILGACDQDAMYFYLGPLMLLHADLLTGSIDKWRERHRRSEKWDCFTVVTKRWNDGPGIQQRRKKGLGCRRKIAWPSFLKMEMVRAAMAKLAGP